jgi:cytochrome c oxidase subunit 4
VKDTVHPIKFFAFIYFLLLLLLSATVAVSLLSLAPWLSTTLSLVIAALKASLVLLYFMNLKSAVPSIRFFAFGAFVWTFLLIFLISLDYLTRGLGGVLGK